MRILITGTTGNSLPPPYGGIPKLVLVTAREWKKQGNEVAITFTYKPQEGDDLGVGAWYFFEYKDKPDSLKKFAFLFRYFFTNPALYLNLLWSYRSIAPRYSQELFLYTAYGVYLDGVFSSFKPDIVLSEAVLIKSFMAAEIARRRNVPVAFDVYAEVRDLSMGENKYLSEDQRKKYWMTFLNKAQLVIGLDNCSVEMKAYVPREKLRIFWDTADTQYFSQHIPQTRTELREHFKLPAGKFLVGAVGSFELRKGHDHLIMAVANLARAGYDVGVVICGGSSKGVAKWKEISRAESIEDNTYFFSALSEFELVKLHRAIDLYTNLSNTQRMCGYDFALVEAMASGLPIVVYDNGALPKTVEGGNGYAVPMNDIPAVSEAILKVYQATPEERKKMGEISAAFAAKIDIRITSAVKLDWFKKIVKDYQK